MSDASYTSLSGAKKDAITAQTQMADCVMHLFKAGFVPSPTSVKADFDANECDFTGYAAATIETWAAPVLAGQGYMTYAPVQTFTFNNVSPFEGNVVGGHYLVDSTGALRSYTTYDPTIPVQGDGQAVVKQPVMVFVAG